MYIVKLISVGWKHIMENQSIRVWYMIIQNYIACLNKFICGVCLGLEDTSLYTVFTSQFASRTPHPWKSTFCLVNFILVSGEWEKLYYVHVNHKWSDENKWSTYEQDWSFSGTSNIWNVLFRRQVAFFFVSSNLWLQNIRAINSIHRMQKFWITLVSFFCGHWVFDCMKYKEMSILKNIDYAKSLVHLVSISWKAVWCKSGNW